MCTLSSDKDQTQLYCYATLMNVYVFIYFFFFFCFIFWSNINFSLPSHTVPVRNVLIDVLSSWLSMVSRDVVSLHYINTCLTFSSVYDLISITYPHLDINTILPEATLIVQYSNFQLVQDFNLSPTLKKKQTVFRCKETNYRSQIKIALLIC